MADKVTWMVLKVDLQCPSCYKKVKKILCKFPQIRDQVYDEQKGLVKITVVCCSREKIRDKLCCKGGKVIKSIQILEPPKPAKPEGKAEPDPPAPQKPKPNGLDKPRTKPDPPPQQKPKPNVDEKTPVVVIIGPEPKADKPKVVEKAKPAQPAADPPKKPAPAPAAPQVVPGPADSYPVPAGFCCPQCYHGHGGGPCYEGFGRPVPPPPCYEYYYYGYGYNNYGKGCYTSRCDYFSEENTSGCTIM